MRGLLSVTAVVGALGFLILGAHGETASTGKTDSKKTAATHKKTTAHRTGTRTSSTAVHKKTGTAAAAHSTRTASSRRGKKSTRRTTWRNRQLTPTPERYKQIQEALAAKGYLPPEQANGQWNDTSAAALKKFQTDQNIDPSGKIDSLSLIALGLGPKHDTAATPRTEPTAPPSKPE
jgi:putative peptidoglycan binding protein